MHNKIIYCDLDGTIIDVSDRLYFFYRKFMKGKKKLTKNSYWNFKKMKMPEDIIVKKTCKDEKFIKNYMKQRKKLLENKKFLKYDKSIKSSVAAVKKLRKNNKVIIVTAREKRSNLLKELKKLKVLKLFDKILSSGTMSKKNMILKSCTFDRKKAIIVGDTEEEIKAGKNLGIKTIAVLSGMRNRKYLKKCKPDLIIKSIKSIR